MLDLAGAEHFCRLVVGDLPLAHCNEQLMASGFTHRADLRSDGYEPCRQSGDEHLSLVGLGVLVLFELWDKVDCLVQYGECLLHRQPLIQIGPGQEMDGHGCFFSQ